MASGHFLLLFASCCLLIAAAIAVPVEDEENLEETKDLVTTDIPQGDINIHLETGEWNQLSRTDEESSNGSLGKTIRLAKRNVEGLRNGKKQQKKYEAHNFLITISGRAFW